MVPTVSAAFRVGATLLASVALAAPLYARPMTAEDVARLESVGTMAVSPDGRSIAFTTTRLPNVTTGEKDGTPAQQLKLATAPDAIRTFLPQDMSVSAIDFSPDGRTISFLWKKGDEKRAVWGIPTDGGAYRKLAAVGDADVRSYAWAPDGNGLFLLAGPAEDTVRRAEADKGFTAIVYEEEARLNRMFSARVGDTVDAQPTPITVPGYVSAFKVTPDGRTGIIDSAPTPSVDDSFVAKRVHIVDLATGQVLRVVETPGKLGDVEVSPDGRTLSMIAAVDVNDPADTTLHLVDVATGQFRALNAGAPEAAIDAHWLPDGRLAAIIHRGARSLLRYYRPNGTVAGEVDAGDLILTDIKANGRTLAVEATTPTHPGELFVVNGNRFTRWTAHNPWLSEITFGRQRVITYAARDGQQIEGILIEPVGGVPAGGAPTIMTIHGGPEAHDSNGWLTSYSSPGQVGAGAGYAVFYPNYRGSTAYGTAFSKEHQGDYAGKEFDDIVDGKRALVAAGVADPNRTGITGGSYGGYASAWGATAQSEEFAASVMFVGISNQVSKFGTTDIPMEMYNVHARKWPWENWMGMLEVSPIYHVDKAETPILIMHGAEDTRVAPSQSYELYRNIKVRKPQTPVRLVLYPGEGHGLVRAAARYDYNTRMMQWFDTYLKTGNRAAPLPAPRPALNLTAATVAE